MKLAVLTVLAAGSAAALHFVPATYSADAAIVAAVLQAAFAHYGVSFGKAAP